MSRVHVSDEYREGDVAVAPNGNKWERSDNDGLWFLSEPDGETSPLDDSIVSALGLQVYREEPEPPFVVGTANMCDTHTAITMSAMLPDGLPVLIVPDTPENRARLAASDNWKDARITKLEEALGVVATGTITMNGFLAHPSIALSILSDTARKALEGQGERT